MEASSAANYLRRLNDLIEKTGDVFERHNYLTIFTAVMLMHLTSMRPIEVERLVERQISFIGGGERGAAEIDVISKANRIFDEWRHLYLPAPYGALLANYQKSAKHIVHSLVRGGAYEYDIIGSRKDSFLFSVKIVNRFSL